MIPSNELRIENWIIIDGVVQKVDRIGQDPLLESNGIELFYINRYRVDECFPIPLTPEILVKAGFECSSKGFWIHPNWYNLSLKYMRGTHALRCNFMDIVANNIDYLHQLQNLYFALTGQELPINNLNTTN